MFLIIAILDWLLDSPATMKENNKGAMWRDRDVRKLSIISVIVILKHM